LKRLVWAAVVVAHVSALLGCSKRPAEGLDVATLPPDSRADYAIFARRCSKCHSLARPLNSGITDDEAWRMYVARMRRQPGSGINDEDSAVILRFLHVYSLDQRRRKRPQLEEVPHEQPQNVSTPVAPVQDAAPVAP
jgi:hypothetical protein